MNKNSGGDFTKGSVFSNLIRMAIPMTVALLINVLYNVVDRVYLGHIPETGQLALTGVGISVPIISIITGFQNLLGGGGAPIFSIARGEGNQKRASEIPHNSCFALVICGIVITVAALLVKEPVLWMIGASAETFDYANDYLQIYILGTVFVMLSLGLNPYINAQGDPKTGMLTVVIGALINIVLDPIFIFVFGMGVKGAALATIIAQGCSALWVLLFLTGKKASIPLHFKGFRPNGKLILRIAGLGLTEFTFAFTNSAVTTIYNSSLQRMGGDIWVTTMTVVNSVREIIFMAVQGITVSARPIIGYNYGAGCYGRVRETIKLMLLLSGTYLMVMWGLLMAFPEAFARMFNDDPALLENCRTGIRLFFAASFMLTFQLTGQNTFVALGRAKYGLTFSLLRKVVLVIPLALILPGMFGLEVKGVFLSEPISDVVGGIACFTTMLLTVGRELSKKEKEIGAVRS